MSNPQTDELTRALRERSDDMSGTGPSLDDVKGRARGIQRRRRAASGLAVAAVALAIAVPMGTQLDGLNRGQQPPVATQAPSPTTDASGPVEPQVPVEVEVEAAAAPRGEGPAILYADGTTLHRPDGSELELPAQYTYLLPYADGVMGFNGGEGERGTTTIVDGQGNPVEGPWDGLTGAISSDGQSVATVLHATGGVDLQLRPRAGADPDEGWTSNVVAFDGEVDLAGFVGPDSVAYDLTVFGDKGGKSTPYVTDWSSEPRELTSVIDLRAANDVTGVVAGMSTMDFRRNEYCFAVVKAATDSVVWDTCEYRLDTFSPDGSSVIGVDPQTDGLGGSTATMLDATNGDVMREFTVPDGFINDIQWESDSTALAAVMQDGTWNLLRLRTDGTVEQVLDPTKNGYEDSSPWRFQITP